MKYKDVDWKAHHLIYFASEDIEYTGCSKAANIKKLQNSLSVSIIHFAILVVLIKLSLLL
jgi:hypothetical protein